MLLCYYLRTMKLTNGVLFIVALWSLVLQVLQMFWRYPERREVEWNYSVMSEANKIDLLLMGWLFRSAHLGFCEGANLDERGLLYKPAIPYCGKNMKSNLIIKVQILSGVTLCRMLHVLISNLTFEPSVILSFFFFFLHWTIRYAGFCTNPDLLHYPHFYFEKSFVFALWSESESEILIDPQGEIMW